MKKVLSLIAILLSFASFAQDSVKVTIGIQTRDLEYIGSFIRGAEDLYDSVKVKFRGVQNPPTGNTVVSFTCYTVDIYTVFIRLKSDPVALVSNCTSRIEAILRALNQTYLTAKLNALDNEKQEAYQRSRQEGRRIYRRDNQ